MRKMFYCVSLFSMSVLLSSVAVAKEARKYTVNSRDGASECDQVGDNLVTNCGFETGTGVFDPWIQSGDTSFSDVNSNGVHTGGLAAEMGPIGDLGYLTQTLPTTGGQFYTLSFWVQNDSSPNEFLVSWDGGVLFDGALDDFLPYVQVVYEGLQASVDGTDLQFGFRNDPSYINLDDVVVH